MSRIIIDPVPCKFCGHKVTVDMRVYGYEISCGCEVHHEESLTSVHHSIQIWGCDRDVVINEWNAVMK